MNRPRSRRVAALAVLVLLVVPAASAAEEENDRPPQVSPDQPIVRGGEVVDGWRFAGLPLVSYASDVGLTLGAALFFYRGVEGYPGEQQSATLSFSYATRGPKAFDLGWGRPRIFGALEFRLNLHLAEDQRMPYWGEGARLGGLDVPAGFGTPPEPYRYHDRRIFAAVVLRGPLFGPVGWHLRTRYLNVGIPEAGPLLAASVPPGRRGGRVLLGEVGLLYDTRDRSLATRRGLFIAASAFVAPYFAKVSDFALHGYNGNVRFYVPLWPGAAIAVRGMYDRKLPGVPGRDDGEREAIPFYERMMYEGYSYDEGLGSASTIRGIARYRISGEEKMLANAQVRVNLFTVHPAGKSLEFGLSAGVDAGRARQPGYEAVEDAGVAAGLRIIWDRAILLRVEMAQARGGDRGLYVAFGEQF